ncbi:hypothetical protein DFH06DRAFT_1170236 [Mycena polygramma]|nr:hypothetical protein DFH06DRAFT_1170236 [Mycena polygramma]
MSGLLPITFIFYSYPMRIRIPWSIWLRQIDSVDLKIDFEAYKILAPTLSHTSTSRQYRQIIYPTFMSSYFAELTANARKSLIESPDESKGYTPKLDTSKLTWVPMIHCGEHVVSLEAAAKAARTKAEQLQDPTRPAAGPLEPFIFSMIVFITQDDFFASSCGRWRGPTLGAPTFADVKLTFTGAAPADPLLAKEFYRSCAKIAQLFESAKSSELHQRQGVFVKSDDPTKRKLRFTHRLFEKMKDVDDDNDEDVPMAFKIHQWPVRHEEARKAISGMASTHRVNYLPAYDASPEGKLIYPSAYDTQLPGALAQIRFTLSHWDIKQDRRDVFNANIVQIRVLDPPQTAFSPSSPGRRKFSAIDDMSGDISPKKARHGSGP